MCLTLCYDILRVQGNEDIVIFENVRVHEKEYVVRMVETLRSRSIAVILVAWKVRDVLERDPHSLTTFDEAASQFEVPLIHIPLHKESCFLPSAINTTQPEAAFYADRVHPNKEGHWLIACMLASLLDSASTSHIESGSDSKPKKDDRNHNSHSIKIGARPLALLALVLSIPVLLIRKVIRSHTLLPLFGIVFCIMLNLMNFSGTSHGVDQVHLITSQAEHKPISNYS